MNTNNPHRTYSPKSSLKEENINSIKRNYFSNLRSLQNINNNYSQKIETIKKSLQKFVKKSTKIIKESKTTVKKKQVSLFEIRNQTSKLLSQTCTKDFTDNIKTFESLQEKQKEWIEKQKCLEISRKNEIKELIKVEHRKKMANCLFSPIIHIYNQKNKRRK